MSLVMLAVVALFPPGLLGLLLVASRLEARLVPSAAPREEPPGAPQGFQPGFPEAPRG